MILAIIGVSIGIILALIVIGLIKLFIQKRPRKRDNPQQRRNDIKYTVQESKRIDTYPKSPSQTKLEKPPQYQKYQRKTETNRNKKENIYSTIPEDNTQSNFDTSDFYRTYRTTSSGVELEKKVAKILKRLPDNKYYVLQNLYVPVGISDITTEIDVVLIHTKGLYVFECKNYNALIQSRNPDIKYWEVKYQSGKYTTIYSPVLQNRGHICSLERYLKRNNCCKSWIVFGNGAVLKVPTTSSEFTLIRENNLYEKITLSLSKETDKFTEDEVEIIYDVLYPLTQVSDEVKRKHIEDVMNHRVFTGSGTGGDDEFIVSDIDEEILIELIKRKKENTHTFCGDSDRYTSPKQITQNQKQTNYSHQLGKNQQYQKKTETKNQHKPESEIDDLQRRETNERVVLRKTPGSSNFFPKFLTAENSGNPELSRKNQMFYDWVINLDHRKLPQFCKILLDGNGFTSIKMPVNEANFISAIGCGDSYLIKISNKKKKVDGHFIDMIQHAIPTKCKDIIVVITSWEFTPEALNAAKRYRIILWDREILSILKDRLEANASMETKLALKRFMKDNKWTG